MSTIGQFDVSGTIVHGGGSRRNLPNIVRMLRGTRSLLVTDPDVQKLTRWSNTTFVSHHATTAASRRW